MCDWWDDGKWQETLGKVQGEGKHDDRRLEIRVNTGGRMTNCQLLAPIFSF